MRTRTGLDVLLETVETEAFYRGLSPAWTLRRTRGAKSMRRFPMVMMLAVVLPGVVGAADIARLAAIPPEATALHAKLAAKVQLSVRLWIDEQAKRLAQGPGDEGALRAAVQARFAGQSNVYDSAGLTGSSDIEALAFIVMMQATNDMDKDLKAIMEEVKAMTAAKQKLRELVSRVNKDVAQNAGKKDMEPCVPPACGGYRTAMMEAGVAMSRARTRTTLAVREPANVQQLKALASELKGQLDGMNELSEMTSLRLQMMMDRRSKLISTLSNVMKKISSTQDTLIQNLK